MTRLYTDFFRGFSLFSYLRKKLKVAQIYKFCYDALLLINVLSQLSNLFDGAHYRDVSSYEQLHHFDSIEYIQKK
jgi:hypothetical protein